VKTGNVYQVKVSVASLYTLLLTIQFVQVEMSPDFKPFRVDVEFSECTEAPIRPLIESLSFISDKRHWGVSFRYGLLKVPANDFEQIAAAMQKNTAPVDRRKRGIDEATNISDSTATTATTATPTQQTKKRKLKQLTLK
jgi:hypothetical protein